MNAITKLEAAVILAGALSFCSMNASAWWDDDDYYDRWHGGPWYDGYPGYGWGTYPGYPGYGWGGYPYRQGRTVIVLPQNDATPNNPPAPEPRLPQ